MQITRRVTSWCSCPCHGDLVVNKLRRRQANTALFAKAPIDLQLAPPAANVPAAVPSSVTQSVPPATGPTGPEDGWPTSDEPPEFDDSGATP